MLGGRFCKGKIASGSAQMIEQLVAENLARPDTVRATVPNRRRTWVEARKIVGRRLWHQRTDLVEYLIERRIA